MASRNPSPQAFTDERASGVHSITERAPAPCVDHWSELAHGAGCALYYDGEALSLASLGTIGSLECEP